MILSHIICILCWVFTTLSQVFFHHHLPPPLYPLLPPLSTLPLCYSPYYLLSIRVFPCCSIPSAFSPSPSTSCPSDSCQSVLCIYASVLILFVTLFCSLHSTYKQEHTVLVLLWRLISLSTMFCSYIHAVAIGKISVFNSQVLSHCVNVPELFDPLIYGWALGLFLDLGYCT